ncbi:hypothetical protein ACHAWU_007944 [Discostella pseudostelligera]|uniref:Pirin N-terminal domain-containing protein n=1 Tax=Discostella pseudostelligera TaxID=259834 RepID=A0ABD3M9D4_9STRA
MRQFLTVVPLVLASTSTSATPCRAFFCPATTLGARGRRQRPVAWTTRFGNTSPSSKSNSPLSATAPGQFESFDEKDSVISANVASSSSSQSVEHQHASQQRKRRPSQRRISRVEKFARLPIWPVWQGVFLFVASRLFGQEVAAKWEDEVGGRVCPNFFEPVSTDPFVLLVHHRHAFHNWDGIRYIQRTFFPEGFPAHPHRGFITVTYCLKGGLIHRDSLGIKQSYGAEERHNGKHVQWLTAGAGIQHEEMWDVLEPDKQDQGKWLWTSSQELYQIWLNLPAAYKMSSPDAWLLEKHSIDPNTSSRTNPTPNSTPIVTSDDGCTITTIVCGEHDGIRTPVKCPTNAAIIRVQFNCNNSYRKSGTSATTWTHVLPSTHETAIVYVRKGSVKIDGERIPPQHTVFLSPDGDELTIEASSNNEEAEILLLTGEPIREPISTQGSMVMNTPQEVQRAYMDYQRGNMGMPWDHKLSDDEWREHVKQNPSAY